MKQYSTNLTDKQQQVIEIIIEPQKRKRRLCEIIIDGYRKIEV